jgi:hypothetical protein
MDLTGILGGQTDILNGWPGMNLTEAFRRSRRQLTASKEMATARYAYSLCSVFSNKTFTGTLTRKMPSMPYAFNVNRLLPCNETIRLRSATCA